jgi:phosphatidylglycerophosphate synthase
MSPAGSSSALLTLPNLLSLSRLPLGGVFWIVLGPGARATTARAVAALGVMALAAVTDMLDGYLARRRGDSLVGAGSWLDPVCDKLFVAAVLGALHFQRGVSLALLALIVSRELLQLPMALVYRAVPALHHWLQYDFRASALGKAATCSQFLAIAALVVGVPDQAARALAFLAFALGVTALADYVRRAIRIGQKRLAADRPPEGAGR